MTDLSMRVLSAIATADDPPTSAQVAERACSTVAKIKHALGGLATIGMIERHDPNPSDLTAPIVWLITEAGLKHHRTRTA